MPCFECISVATQVHADYCNSMRSYIMQAGVLEHYSLGQAIHILYGWRGCEVVDYPCKVWKFFQF